MNVRPLFDRILLQRSEEPTRSKGGLYLPETSKEKPQNGKVLAVGAGRVNADGTIVPLQVQVGDVVVFGKYSGTEIKLNGEERLIIREEDLLGVLE